MERDATAAWLATQRDLLETAPSTTIVPAHDKGIQQALGLLEQMAGKPLLASVQLKPGPVLGEGGMGIVRSAEQVALGRTVAVKTLKKDKRTPDAAQDLLREAWVTGSLEHPNVVPVHHLGLDEDGMPALVLKRIEGVEWSKLVGDAAEVKRRYGATDMLAWNLSILMQVLNAIRFAHSRGIVHRDLKPTNVMIGDFGEVYLLDWGIAVSLRDDGSGRLPLAKDAMSIAGTPCYMAPEMLQPDGDVRLGEHTDVYLAGAVLFEIVAGRPPHGGKTALEVMTSVLTSEPEVPDDVPPELAGIIARAMASKAADRFPSAEALRQALQGFLEHRGSDQLVARARARLDELAAILARPPEDRERHREDVYRLFGACRFGFHEALAAWHDNASARAGLRRATIAVAEYELATGDAHSAVTLLTELDEPPALLEQARAAAARQADRRQQLERLSHTHDLAVGRAERARIGGTLGIIFTVTPFIAVVWPSFDVTSHAFMAVWSLVFAVISMTWTWFWRDRLSTLVNRRLIGALVLMFGAQTVLAAGTWISGIPIEQAVALMMFLYFVVASGCGLMVDPQLLPCSFGYLVAFFVAARWPAERMFALAGGNAVFALTMMLSRRLPKK